MVRDKTGRFVKGHKGIGGRPPKKTEEKYLELMLSVVTPERWIKIIERATEQAERGDSTARKFLADYIVGPPVERKEITGASGGPIVIVNWDETNSD